MARTGTQFIHVSGTSNTHLYGTYQLVSQNINNNTSTIRLRLYFTYSGGTTVASSYSTFKLDGTTVKSGSYSYKPGDHLLGQKDITVTHNADGTFPGKSVSVYSYSYQFSKDTDTGSIPAGVIATIPRASSVTATDAAIESSTSINISRASGSFKHTLKYAFEGLTGTIASDIDTSYGWTIPTSFYAKMTNILSAKCTIICETYSGDILIGTKETTFNVSINAAINKPDIDATFEDINELATSLTGSNNKLIKFVSEVKVTMTATAKNGATIVSKKIICGDGKSLNDNGTLSLVESGKFTITAIDSRGISNSKEYNLEIVDYIKLTLNVEAFRPTPTDNQIAINFKGNYYNNSFGLIDNNLDLKYRYKPKEGNSWTNYSNLNKTLSDNNYSNGSSEINLGDMFDYNNAYDFEFVATDKIMSVAVQLSVAQGLPNFDWGKDDFQHNTVVYLKSGNELLDYEKNDNRIQYRDAKGNNLFPETGLFKKIGTFDEEEN